MSHEVAIGPHRAAFHAPSTMHLTFTGDIEAEHAARVIEECGTQTEGKPFIILLHTPGMKGVSPQARKVFADGFKEMPLVAAGFIGASIRTRAIATFVVAAINVLRDKKMAVSFFDDDNAARSWAAEQLASWSAAA